jgi:F-type H+-transporting ATPase subunit b
VTIHALAFSVARQAAGEHSPAGPLGVPMWVWQLVNLVGFFALLLYFVARPITEMFRRKQVEIEERARESRERRAAAARLETEIHERMARLDVELAEVRARGAAEGEAARAELLARAEQDSERVRKDVTEEIERRLVLAKEELRRTASELTASTARELVSGQITGDDRRRLLEESVEMVQREGPR